MRDYNAILERVKSEISELNAMVNSIESLEARLRRAIRNLNDFSSIGEDTGVRVIVSDTSFTLGRADKMSIKEVLSENQIKACEEIILELEKVSLGITGVDVTQSQTRVLEI